MNRRRRREPFPWYMLTGLVLGLGLGLFVAWGVAPVKYVDTAPASLRGDFKDLYRLLIARAYLYDGSVPRARARLALLHDENPARALAAQAQHALAQGQPERDVRALGSLAAALGQAAAAPSTGFPSPSPFPVWTFTPTPTATASPTATPVVFPGGTPSPSPSPTGYPTLPPTPTPLPTRTPVPTPTPGAPFVLVDQQPLCDPQLGMLLQFWLEDSQGNPVPGAEIVVTWDAGEEHIFTGLKPDIGPGYADFRMTQGQTYHVRPLPGGQPVSVQPWECQGDGQRFWGGWRLTFRRP